MPRLTLSLFGPTQFTRQNDRIVEFAYDKVLALLALLATEADRAHRRETLAGFLWPDQDESSARHNLNQALWNLRATVGDREVDRPALRSTREAIQFDRDASCFVDVLAFDSLLQRVDQHAHRRPETCRRCAEWLSEAAELYRGPFLEQFSLADCPEFEQWMLTKREHFDQRVGGALERLVEFCARTDDADRAIAYLRRLVDLDPWREDGHRRLMHLLAQTGQRAAALAHFERLQVMLRDELDTDVEPETRRLRDEIGEGSYQSTLNSVPETNRIARSRLPRQMNPLVGRKRAMAELATLVSSGGHRLITLMGPGGIGKTRLAVQLANEERDAFVDGACFVPLSGLESADSLTQAIADACSLTFYGSRDPRDQLLDGLSDRELLLVLDNFEHLLSDVALITNILDRALGVHVLVTSREQLGLYGELVFPVQALDIPDPTGDVETIEHAGAFQLFVESAKRSNALFTHGPSEVPDIACICALVGGIPLGIELAAAWTPLLSCHEIASEIGKSLDFLSTSLRDVPERHRSVRAAFDHSWRMLNQTERSVFARLSVFHGGFQKEAAEHVAGASLATLMALMNKSFMARNPMGRFEIHELLRQYGAEKLNDLPNQRESTHDAHARFYAGYLIDREARLKLRGRAEALQDLVAESENVRAAWTWTLANARVDILDVLVNAWLFYEVTGRYREIENLLSEAVGILEQSTDTRAEVALARALTRRSVGIHRIGAFNLSEPDLKRSNGILRRHGEFGELALNLNFMAMIAHAADDHDTERELLEESLRMSRLAGDDWITAYSLNDLGMVTCLLGDMDAARRMIQESLETFDSIGDQRGMAFALNNLGTVLCRRGEYDEARRLLQRSLDARHEMDDRWGMAQSLIESGVVALMMSDYAESGEHFRAALRIANDLHAHPLVLEVLPEIAKLFTALNDHDRANAILSRIEETGPSAVVELSRTTLSGGVDDHPSRAPARYGSSPLTRLNDIIAMVLEQNTNAEPEPTHPRYGIGTGLSGR